ncbi:MAG: DnaJ domain-containing protein [Deltaproteobacteria bacterium]|nr:DnaJ domain-containing protein [Deltaproteobacteria bacterium]
MSHPSDALQKRVAPKDITEGLTAEEYFLWSRLQSEIDVKDLLPLCPWSEDETLKKLESLIQKNSAQWVAASSKKNSFKSSADFSNVLDEEDKNPELKKLDREFRLSVLVKESELEKLNHYEILEVYARATEKELKESYLKISKKFHPDRFFSKNLGAYKKKLDLIFSKIQKAYGVLKNPIERKAYDQRLSIQSPSPETPAAKPKKKILDPEIQKIGKAEHYYKAGLAQQKERNYLAAGNSFALAFQMNPSRDIYKKAYEQMKPLMAKEKGKQTLENAKIKFENLGASKEILSMVEEVLHSDPGLADAQLFSGKLILDLGITERVRDAKERLLRAKAVLSKDPEASFQLGRAYLALGDFKAAEKEFEETLKRNPSHLLAKKQLDKLQDR